jgi:hypothetical protein
MSSEPFTKTSTGTGRETNGTIQISYEDLTAWGDYRQICKLAKKPSVSFSEWLRTSKKVELWTEDEKTKGNKVYSCLNRNT